MEYHIKENRICHDVHEFGNIYDMIRRAFQPIVLAQRFTVQFLQKTLTPPNGQTHFMGLVLKG